MISELSEALIGVTKELGYQAPTPIQAQCIPLLLNGKDVIGQSQTGSGKTAAFALPILNSIRLDSRHVQALILCPTRELCAQVGREIRKLGRKHPGLQVLLLSGGAPMRPQLKALEKGVHIIVGTPGRLLDHLKRGTLDLSDVATVVLDEADRMLEMGFQSDMEWILSHLPKDRQTALFSATFPITIENLSRKYQRAPVRITIEADNKPGEWIEQIFYEVLHQEKPNALLSVFRETAPESALVFCNLKSTVSEVALKLQEAGISVAALHGDLEQRDRDRVMAKFRNRSVRILVATDVAARGLDVENLDTVFNYDLPAQAEIYVHRIGRTGRAGKKGQAVSFFSVREKAKIQSIEKFTGTQILQKKLTLIEHSSEIHGQASMQTLYISAGRKEKMRPGDILGALTGEAGGLDAASVGKIEIHDHFSYVAVSSKVFSVALERLMAGKIKGRKFNIAPVR